MEEVLRKRHALLVEIPEEDVKKELGLFYKIAETWGEPVAWTYLVKHSEKIEPKLELLGVGELHHTWLKKGQYHRLDLLFRKDDTYYPVEVKHHKPNWNQLFQEVECFEHDMKKRKVWYQEIIPVLVVYGEKEYTKKPYHWPEWWLGPI